MIDRFVKIVAVVCLVLLLGLQLHNLREFPIWRGFDAVGHLEYVEYLQMNRNLPLANQGW